MAQGLLVIKSIHQEFDLAPEEYTIDTPLRLLRRLSDDKPVAYLDIPASEMRELLAIIEATGI